MENIIEIRSLKKCFEKHKILDDISADFEKGKIYGIIGRNGSGKTVLFKCICGLMHYDAGEILINGKKIGVDIDIAENVGAIIENPGFLPYYSGAANLKMLMGICGKKDKDRIYKCMKMTGLDPDDKKHVCKYSLGMRQRLGISQAIMDDPDILLLDEPMNGLDNKGVDEMRALFLQLKQQSKTILLSSHNREDIDLLCDVVYEMENGKMKRNR
ncbi:MAG: ATP-binding cassette domain-containing protein [Lachnospiraceae bacterium]|nr:ATP-binding cassette domain-containing protein [Lachnospiraceae bacterium]